MFDKEWPYLVAELQAWERDGYLRYYGVEEGGPDGALYVIESTPGNLRRLTELQAHQFMLGLFAGKRPRFPVRTDSPVSTSAEVAA
jgi:hypothetical protein